MEHKFEPTDSQGYSMECIVCGVQCTIGEPEWDKIQDENCSGREIIKK